MDEIENQPNQQKPKPIRIQHAQVEQQIFTGPLPPPEILVRYNDASSGAADRIIAMAEKQAEHRQKMERWREGSEIALSFTGQLCALIFVLVMVVAAAYCIVKGQPWGGVGLGATGIVSVVYAFIRGHKQKQQSTSPIDK